MFSQKDKSQHLAGFSAILKGIHSVANTDLSTLPTDSRISQPM